MTIAPLEIKVDVSIDSEFDIVAIENEIVNEVEIIAVDEENFDIELGIAMSPKPLPDYTDEYIVTPLAHAATVLPTSGRTLAEDVTVLEIPYYETSNVSGRTIYIGSEV